MLSNYCLRFTQRGYRVDTPLCHIIHLFPLPHLHLLFYFFVFTAFLCTFSVPPGKLNIPTCSFLKQLSGSFLSGWHEGHGSLPHFWRITIIFQFSWKPLRVYSETCRGSTSVVWKLAHEKRFEEAYSNRQKKLQISWHPIRVQQNMSIRWQFPLPWSTQFLF